MKKMYMMKNTILIVLLSLLITLNSCNKSNSSAQSEKSGTGGNKWHEAPVLHELVEKGELPKLKERIPSAPLVEVVHQSIGTYGGVMRKVWRGAGKDKWGVTKMMEEYLCRYQNGKIIPNVAQSFEVKDNSTRFIFHLREGMKWSDGEPFTANDVIFYWEEVLKKEVTGKKAHVSVRDAMVKLIDKYSFEISFPTPRHLFLIDFMSAREFFTPAHYAKTILPDFIGAEKAAELAKNLGFSDTQAMLKQKLYYFWMESD
ncbi:MAG: ABC transporter substrate-binding protein, partial [Spirochaetes bacterium]|nr:ABC transporter substrate-binding protein [Spirochaetota bacterium]